MNLIKFIIVIYLLAAFPCFALGNQLNNPSSYNLNYQELTELSKAPPSQGLLKEKVDHLLNTPIIENSTNTPNTVLKESPKLGKFIRVASWNISRGFNLDTLKLLFGDPEKFVSTAKFKDKSSICRVNTQAEFLRTSDIIILNEVDIGMPRTGYKNIAEELAKALNFNYAYGTEFLEVDPAHLGLEEHKWSEENLILSNNGKFEIDKGKYKGLHGNAILSRFPLKNCRIIRLPQAYDWFNSEKNRISELETLKRHAAEVLFREDMLREIRIGGRIALLADIEIPGLQDPITIVALHLENRTVPAGRKTQIIALLKEIYNIKNPVIMAGDFNSTNADATPTGVKRELEKKLKDPEFLAKTALSIAVPPAGTVNYALLATNFARQYSDPTVKSIPIIAPNPELDVFKEIRKAEFADNHKFDFRGNKMRSSNGRSQLLSNSNERSLKGFTPTFIFERPLIIGKYKLDWIFVKPYIKETNDKDEPYRMAPHYGRTLYDLNYAFDKPLSDHVPITVDLPVEEPKF